MPLSQPEILLIYDQECPACRRYSQIVRIKQSVGELRIINARDDSTIMAEITARGFDIDQGMVLKLNNEFYYGAEAVHALALISSRSGLFNRCNYWLFSSKSHARALYPLLRSGRNLLLKLLKKQKINNLDIKNNQNF